MTENSSDVASLHEWYFTFGQSHCFANRYVKVKAASSGEARSIMFKHFGNKWSSQYENATAAGVYRFHLILLEMK